MINYKPGWGIECSFPEGKFFNLSIDVVTNGLKKIEDEINDALQGCLEKFFQKTNRYRIVISVRERKIGKLAFTYEYRVRFNFPKVDYIVGISQILDSLKRLENEIVSMLMEERYPNSQMLVRDSIVHELGMCKVFDIVKKYDLEQLQDNAPLWMPMKNPYGTNPQKVSESSVKKLSVVVNGLGTEMLDFFDSSSEKDQIAKSLLPDYKANLSTQLQVISNYFPDKQIFLRVLMSLCTEYAKIYAASPAGQDMIGDVASYANSLDDSITTGASDEGDFACSVMTCESFQEKVKNHEVKNGPSTFYQTPKPSFTSRIVGKLSRLGKNSSEFSLADDFVGSVLNVLNKDGVLMDNVTFVTFSLLFKTAKHYCFFMSTFPSFCRDYFNDILIMNDTLAGVDPYKDKLYKNRSNKYIGNTTEYLGVFQKNAQFIKDNSKQR